GVSSQTPTSHAYLAGFVRPSRQRLAAAAHARERLERQRIGAADRQRGRGLFVGEGAHRLAVLDAREAPAERRDALAPILRTDAAFVSTQNIAGRTAEPAAG